MMLLFFLDGAFFKNKRCICNFSVQIELGDTFVGAALLLFSFCQRFNRQAHAKLESVLEYCLFRQAGVLTPAIIELLKDLNLLFAHRFLEIIVMPSHVLHQFFHFR